METTGAKLEEVQVKLERSGEEEAGLGAECQVGERTREISTVQICILPFPL